MIQVLLYQPLFQHGRDAHAHALITMIVKQDITLHIHSCKTTKEAWDTLVALYQMRNEAHVAYLWKQLDDHHMNEEASMDGFFTKVKDLKNSIIIVDEVILTVH